MLGRGLAALSVSARVNCTCREPIEAGTTQGVRVLRPRWAAKYPHHARRAARRAAGAPPHKIRTLQLSILRSRSATSTPPLARVSAAQAPLGPPPITATRSFRLSASPSLAAWTRTDRLRPIWRPATARRCAEARWRGWAAVCILSCRVGTVSIRRRRVFSISEWY
jgi:hypothetical protein